MRQIGSNPCSSVQHPFSRRLDSTPVKFAFFLGVAGSELLVHALHMLSAPALTAFVESHMAESEFHTMWHDALVEWLPTAATAAGFVLLYKHLHAHTALFYVRRGRSGHA